MFSMRRFTLRSIPFVLQNPLCLPMLIVLVRVLLCHYS
jgi:hypothetical protein